MLDLGTLTGYLELNDDAFDSVIEGLPDKMKGGGLLLAGAAGLAAVGVGAALSSGLNQAIELDDAQHKITAQLGLTEAESARIGGVAGTLFTQAYGESVEEVNTAVQDVVSSIDGMRGATEESLEAMTAKALNFASAFEIDTARSTQVVGQLIKTGLVADANEGFDLLTSAMQKVPAAVREDILDAADEYGPFFETLGLTGAESFDLLVRSSEKGMYGIDKAGDALKEFTIRATDMSTASGAAYEALGMDQQAMTNELLAGGDRAGAAFDTIVAGLQGIEDPSARSQAALALFGTPLEDLSVSEIPTFLSGLQDLGGGMEDAGGAADRMGEAINGGATVGWTELQRTWDSIIGQLGAGLLPVLSEVVGFLNDNPAILNLVAGALGAVAIALGVAAAAQWVMNSALLASPLTWIILAVVALVAAIVALAMNWDAVVAVISDVWNGFISWFTGVMDGFLTWWDGVWQGFLTFLEEAWVNIGAAVETALAWVLDLFLNWTLLGLLIQYWDEIVAGATSAWNGLISFFEAIPGWILSIFVAAGAWLIATGSNIINGMRSGVENGWNGLMSFLNGIPGAVMGFFSGAGDWLVNAGRWIIDGLLSGLKAAWEGVTGFISGVGDWIAANKGPESYDRQLLVRHGGWIMGGLSRGLEDSFVRVQDQVHQMAGQIEASFGEPTLNARVGSLVGADDVSAASGAYSAAGAGYSPGAPLRSDEQERWEALTDMLGELSEAVRNARPIEVHSNDPEEVAVVVAEHLR